MYKNSILTAEIAEIAEETLTSLKSGSREK
jgi:hypothetical protein